MPYSQAERLIAFESPLGKDVLLLEGFTGQEGISRLFHFNLDLLSENNSLAYKNIIGQRVSIRIKLQDDKERYINGFVSRFSQSGGIQWFTRYQAEVVPWLWFLTRTADCRIFQNMTIPDIIAKIFSDLGFTDFKKSLQGTYSPREYCVQYRETDFNFISRLMEQYGIFYYFEHTKDKHTLVLADSPSAHQPCPHQPKARYDFASAGIELEDVVTSWQVFQELRPGKYALTDYNFETPSTSLMANVPSTIKVGGNDKFEIYDYPGEYLSKGDGDQLAKIRMQEEEAPYLVGQGASTCRAFASGYTFTLEDYYRQDLNQAYVLTEVRHFATTGGAYHSGVGGSDKLGESYSNRFSAIPKSVPYRPPRLTPKPAVQGPQTAVVVGKKGEEIWVDKYGRVKVQFHWDREGKRDEKSSCWIRVSQPWAGKNWGAMWIPRIGQEVIVEFLEGDPDQPIITGRVYNAEVMPPYELPKYQTRSTFQSRSSKGGASANYNEIRFEDLKGKEQIFINAERDLDVRVEKESREFVGANRHLIVTSNQQETVQGEKHGHVQKDHFEKIDGSMSLQVGKDRMVSIGGGDSLQVGGDQSESIGGDQSLKLSGNRLEEIGGNASLTLGGDHKSQVGGSVSLTVGGSRDETVGQKHALQSGQEIHLQAGMKVIIEAGMQLSLVGPGGFVDIGPAGVTIQGTMVLINSGGAAGSGSGASPQGPDSPKDPVAPKDPKEPDVADDGSKGDKLN